MKCSQLVQIHRTTIILKEGKVLGWDAAESLKGCVLFLWSSQRKSEWKENKQKKTLYYWVTVFTLPLPTVSNRLFQPKLESTALAHQSGALRGRLPHLSLTLSPPPISPLWMSTCFPFLWRFCKKNAPCIWETNWSWPWLKNPFFWWTCQKVGLVVRVLPHQAIPSANLVVVG